MELSLASRWQGKKTSLCTQLDVGYQFDGVQNVRRMLAGLSVDGTFYVGLRETTTLTP